MAIYLSLAAIAAALAISGCASTTGHESSGQSAQAMTPKCIGAASRIPSGDDVCTGAGRSYSSEDLDRTGVTSVAAALQLLDPAVSSRH